jgi:GABA(A) receptor-associated protein
MKEIDGAKLLQKYPDKIPIVLERGPGKDDMPNLPNSKFLVPRDLTVAQFIYTIRKRVELPPAKAIYLFFGNVLPSSALTVGQVYEQYHNPKDLVLHGTYTSECTFG